jgi:hypothetical protein
MRVNNADSEWPSTYAEVQIEQSTRDNRRISNDKTVCEMNISHRKRRYKNT